jgi:hypothetical protein
MSVKYSTIAPTEDNGGVPVNVQDQTSRALDLDFLKVLAAPTTLSAPVSIGSYTIDVTSTTGFTAGEVVGISGGTGTPAGQFYFGQQVGSVSGSTVTLDTPLDKAYPSGANVFPATWKMNVNGSVTSQVFQIGPLGVGSGIEADITKIVGYLQSTSDMDDALFGSLAALTRGLSLRKNFGDGSYENLWTCKSNGGLALKCANNFAYTTKAPSGSYGARWVYSLSGSENHGVVARLAGGETLELLVQDNLTGLTVVRHAVHGHYTQV